MKIIVKTAPGRDRYVIMCTISDAPLFLGDRGATARWLLTHGEAGNTAEAGERLARADTAGTSALPDPPDDPVYGWQDTVLPVGDHLFGDDMLCLPREHLEAFTIALAEGRAGDARALTRPCTQSPGPPVRCRTLDDLAGQQSRSAAPGNEADCDYPGCRMAARTKVNGKKLCRGHGREYRAFLRPTRPPGPATRQDAPGTE